MTGTSRISRWQSIVVAFSMVASLVVVLPGQPTSAQTAPLTVDTNDVNCSDVDPQPNWCTIGAAIGGASNGDTIEVAPGVYNEVLSIDKTVRIVGMGSDAAAVQINADGIVQFNGAVSVSGAIEPRLENLTITGAFTENPNSSFASLGGGITIFSGALTLIDVRVTGNRTISNGGGIHARGTSSSVIVINSTIDNNIAGSNGAGMYITDGASAEVFNSTISGNTDGPEASSTGAVNIRSGSSLFMNHSTVVDNDVAGFNSGVSVDGGGAATVVNSILANNAGQDCSGGFTDSSGYNLVETIPGSTGGDPDGSCNLILGTTSVDPGIDPQLGPLADSGGPTPTHVPSETSPALDVAFQDPAFDCSEADDQRGLPRPSGFGCDIGAVELQVEVATPLQDLIDLAGPGDTVVVPPGVYTESIIIGDDITLLGGGETAADTVIDATGLGTRTVTLSGSVTSDNASFENLTITGGESTSQGGNILNDSAELTLTDVVVSNGTAPQGGGVFSSGILSISGSTIVGNTATSTSGTVGGGIGALGTVNIDNSTIHLNTAGADGGGIGLLSGTASLNNVTITANDAAGRGGAFNADPGGAIQISNSLSAGNSSNPTLQIDCSTFESLGHNVLAANPAGCLLQDSDVVATGPIGPLTDNGGRTPTRALGDGHPAIDAGSSRNYEVFDSTTLGDWRLNGFTDGSGGELLLAAPGPQFTAGSAYLTDPIDATEDFRAEFQFRIDPDADSEGADGITFTITDDPTDLGGTGGFLGIGGAPAPVGGVSVEFDTWLNGQNEGANDADALDEFNHIGINEQGSLSSVAFNTAPIADLSDGSVWTARVDYDASTGTLDAYASNTGTLPASPTVSTVLSLDIFSLLDDPIGYVGFTGATGSEDISGTQQVLNFTFDGATPCADVDQRGVARPQGSRCDVGAFEVEPGPTIPTELTVSVSDGGSIVGDQPIFPIDELDVGSFFGLPAGPSSTQLGAIQLGAIQLGAIQLGAIDSAGLGAPSGYLTIDSILEAADELAASPTILDQITLVDVPIVGGWDPILALSSNLIGRPAYTVTLQQAIDDPAIRTALEGLRLADSGLAASQLGAIQLGAIQLGAIQLGAIQLGAIQLGAIGDVLDDIGTQLQTICATGDIDCTALGIDPAVTDSFDDYSITALTLLGVDIDFAQLGAIQLGAIQLGAIDPNDTQLGAIQLGAIQLGAIDTDAGTIGNTQLGAIQLGAIQLGAIQLGAIEAAIDQTVVGGDTLPALLAYWCGTGGGLDCEALGIDPTDPSTAEGYSILALGAMGAQLGAIQLGAIQLGAIDNLESTQLGAIQLGAIEIDGTAIADTQLGAIQLGAIDPSATQLGAIQLGAIQLGAIQLGAISPAATQLGAIQLGAIQLGSIASPTQLGAIQLGAINGIDAVIDCTQLPGGSCAGNENLTLVEAAQLGAIQPGATLQDLEGAFGSVTLQDLVDAYDPTAGTLTAEQFTALVLALVISDFYPETTIAELPPGLTLDQVDELWVGIPLFELLLAIMDPGDLAWEDVDPAIIATQNPVLEASWAITFELAGTPGFVPGAEAPFSADVTVDLPEGVSYVPGTSGVAVNPTMLPPPVTGIGDPEITDDTLTWTIDDVELNDSIYLGFLLSTAFTADETDPIAATVETLGFTAEGSGLTIVTDAEPNDTFAQAIEIEGDVVVLGRTDVAGDVDIFELNVAPGGSIEAYLTPGDVDLDLVLFDADAATDPYLRGTPERVVDGSLDPVIGIDPTEQDQESLDDIVNTDLAPVFKASLRRGIAGESIITPPLRSGGQYFLQITSYNDVPSDEVYVGRVRVLEPPAESVCAPRPLANAGAGTRGSLPSAQELASAETIYLMNTQLFADTYGATARDEVLAAIAAISGVPGAPDGVVVPVEGDTQVFAAYNTWLSQSGNCSVDDANRVAVAIAELVDQLRVDHPTIASVVIVGGDDQIPFFRVDDEGIVANEREYLPTFSGNNPLIASLRDGQVLTDAPYTDANPLYVPQGDREVFVSQLPTGRLVEEPAEMVASLNQFVASGGLLDTATANNPDAEVLGYDFLSDSSQDIADSLAAQGFDVTSIINETWTRAQLEAAYDAASAIVNGNAHFDHTAALPAEGNLTSTFTDLYTVDDLDPLGSSIYAGSIIYTMGCHAGLNAPGAYMDAADPLYDWAQALLGREAVYVANTGFGYGDSEFKAYSEELMFLLTEQFAVSGTVGQAFLNAQQLFASQTPKWSPYHDKSLMEATLYGLPFYRLTELDVTPPDIPTTSTSPVAGTALESASVSVSSAITERGGPIENRFLVADDVLAVPFRPVQPIEYLEVTPLDDALRAAGAVVESATSTDLPDFDVLYARPIVYNETAEPEIETTGAFPNSLQSVTSYETQSGRADRLLVTRGRYFPEFQLQQRWDDMDLTVYYASVDETDVTAPKITRVNASVIGGSQVSFDVNVSDAQSDVVRVLVLYRSGLSGATADWTSVDLVARGDGSWAGGGALAGAPTPVDYVVQAVNAAGLVSVNTFKGEFHEAVAVPAPPADVTCNGGSCSTDWYRGDVTIAGDGDVSIDGAARVPLPVTLSEDGVYQLDVEAPDGSSSPLVVAIDRQAPTLTPGIDGSVVVRGRAIEAGDVCVDAVSGVVSCVPILDTSNVGAFTETVTAVDGAGNEAELSVEYVVVDEITLAVDPSQLPLGDETTLTTGFTYSGESPIVTIDWGDGTVDICADGDPACGFTIGSAGQPASLTRSHTYSEAGVYRVTVDLAHGNKLTQAEIFEYAVVYDPTGGYVYGAGWIYSPPGAYAPAPDAEGPASFGFVSKYRWGRNTPSGVTVFRFRAGDFTFVSWNYDWLVVTKKKAQYRGTGYVLGQPGQYDFVLTATDAAQTNSTDVDLFRIKIWDRTNGGVVYDNNRGAPDDADPTTEIEGGYIVIGGLR